MDTDITALTDDQLTDEITTWAGRIAAAEAHLIDLVAELDRRGSWFGPGLLSTAHWLSWRLGMGLKAAHERVRVARALPTLPLTNDAFHAGRLSWTQVRAVTRVASADDEATYLECARHASGAQLEKLVRGVRRARKPSEDAADPERAAWLMRTRLSYDDDGTLVVTIRMPAERGAIVIAALESAMADLDLERQTVRRAESSAEDATGPTAGTPAAAAPAAADADAAPEPVSVPRATHAEGLLQLCEGYLARVAEDQPGRARRGRARLRVHIDPLSGWSRLHDGELLPPGTSLTYSQAAIGSGLRVLTPADSPARTSVAPGTIRAPHSGGWSGRSMVSGAGSPAAPGDAGCTRTTSRLGRRAVRLTWPISCSSARATTRWCTPRASSSCCCPTAAWSSRRPPGSPSRTGRRCRSSPRRT